MFRRYIKRITPVLVACVMTVSTICTYATPNAYKYGNVSSYNIEDIDENPTGIEHGEETSLKQDITKLIPMLEDTLQKVYDRTVEKLKVRIRENKWDLDYTMQSFYDIGNPYKDIDYNKFIATYATIIEMGRNNRPWLSDVPLIRLDAEEVDDGEVKYAFITVRMLDEDGLLRFYGYDPQNKKIRDKIDHRIEMITEALKEEEKVISQNIFVNLPSRSTRADQETMNNLANYTIPDDISIEKQKLIVIALSLVGQIPYDWGGKASHEGWNSIWNTWNESTGRRNGLDCSGFVNWVYMSAGYDRSITNGLYSTYVIRESLQDITAEELRPGDIGLLKNNSIGTNHTGIYLGHGLWIHCASSKGGVCVNTAGFRYFKRAPEGYINEEILERNYQAGLNRLNNLGSETGGVQVVEGTDGVITSEEDIYTFAQLIEHEVGGEPYDAWVAVAEVVLNRVNYDTYFPDTIVDVIYQKGQFSYVNEIKDIVPRPEVIAVATQVAAGRLKYFNYDKVLFFKNPTITDGIPAEEPVDWGTHPWYMAVGATAFYLDDATSIREPEPVSERIFTRHEDDEDDYQNEYEENGHEIHSEYFETEESVDNLIDETEEGDGISADVPLNPAMEIPTQGSDENESFDETQNYF